MEELPIRVIADPAFCNREINPYNWLLYTNLVALGVNVEEYSPSRVLSNRFDIWHMHWPELCLKHRGKKRAERSAQALLSLMDRARQKGVKVVWTVHNLSSHEQMHPKLEADFWTGFTNRIDGYVALSETGLKAVRALFPRLDQVPGFVVPHGHYRGEYPDKLSRQTSRAQLGITDTAKVLLFFGKFRPYKNVTELIAAFRSYSDSSSVLLLVGDVKGRFPEYVEKIRSESASDDRVRLYLGYVPKERVQVYFRSADLAVLPYREILTSGVALLALSFDLPVLMPLQDASAELQNQVGAKWVRTYSGEIGPEVIGSGLDWALSSETSARPSLDTFDSRELAVKTLDAYHSILGA